MKTSSSSALLIPLLAAACSGGAVPGPTAGSPDFDGERAFELLRTQVDFGPRVPGTPGHAAQLTWMLETLEGYGPEIAADTFSHVTQAGDSLALVNVVARFRPEQGRRILLLAHWDTRPTADEEADSTLRSTPIPGANDGASGVAVLLELARLFSEAPPPLGVDLLFVDGEDVGPETPDMFLGARRYASRLPTVEESTSGEGPVRPLYGVLLDMVADADPRFPVEGHSAEYASPVVQKVWRAAERLGYRDLFPTSVGERVYDDHIPLLEAGLMTANVIDIQYGPGNAYWHTHQDDIHRVSAETLERVGSVMVELVYSGG